jgi:phosphoglycerol transferase MdoB-like AlkP superfamily enzyme
MLAKMKRKLGVLFPFVATILLCLGIFLLSRLALVGWQWSRFVEFGNFEKTLISGLRIDIATVSYLFILPAFLASFLLWQNPLGKVYGQFLRLWITASLWFIVYMEVATFPFIQEYDLRPNRLFIEYLIYPKEVFNMLWSGYKLELVIGAVTSALSVVFGWKVSGWMLTNLGYQKWYWRPVLAVIVLAAGVMGARSTLGHRPLNPAMVAYSTDPLMNDLLLNSSYSVLFSAKQMGAENDAFDFYPKLKPQDIITQVRQSLSAQPEMFLDGAHPTYRFHPATYQNQPKNIVILLLESHGARYVSKLGGADLSPTIDKLYEEGWGFTRLYATGTRSVRGIEAVTTGFVPSPSRSTVKLDKSQHHFFTIAHLLKTRGYHTQFVYGGESHFDNMKSFFLGNGFEDMQDLPTFTNPTFVGSWGASDQDVYQHAHESFMALNQANQSFFSLVFSSSNHSPFEYPDNVIEPYNTPKQTVENAVKYADYALGEFIEKAKAASYWNNTIFVAVADHDARVYGSQVIPIENFHIPAVIFGGGVEPKLDDRLVSQLDLPTTLLSLAGISSVHPMVGYDLTQAIAPEQQRAMMQRDKTFAWMDAAGDVVVFQPHSAPQGYQYDREQNRLAPTTISNDKVHRANAYALWGSLAYQEEFYAQRNVY